MSTDHPVLVSVIGAIGTAATGALAFVLPRRPSKLDRLAALENQVSRLAAESSDCQNQNLRLREYIARLFDWKIVVAHQLQAHDIQVPEPPPVWQILDLPQPPQP